MAQRKELYTWILVLTLLLSGCGATAITPAHSAIVAPRDSAAPAAASSAAGAPVSIWPFTSARVQKSGSVQTESIAGNTADTAYSMEAPPMGMEPGLPDEPMNTEDYATIRERGFVSPLLEPLSTFSADVDTASWSNIRRFLNTGASIPVDAVRIEEMINYFPYGYAEPTDDVPFAVHPELAPCPWNTDHLLMRVGIQGKRIEKEALPPSNLVFLLDVSGSMNDPMKLPLVKTAFSLLVEQMKETDRISIVTYAGDDRIVLEGAAGGNKAEIMAAINDLTAGGTTAGARGIETAYRLAERHFLEGGNNRVILATDGDFNVGVSSDSELTRLVEKKREKGVFLSVLGFGVGNIKDNKMEALADNGNGNYAYIDSVNEARKVLVSEMGGTLFTIAKDVKFQVEFNPAMIKGYRLIGYENRMLAAEDFNNDAKDAGDIGAGHSVTALYELIPATSGETVPGVDPLRYGSSDTPAEGTENNPDGGTNASPAASDEWLTVKIRYKAPEDQTSQLLIFPIERESLRPVAGTDFLFQSAVAEAGLVLRNSAYKGGASLAHAVAQAKSVLGEDTGGYRQEFISLMEMAQTREGAAQAQE
jgi:Ca-activated chloride channel family protein